MSNIIVMAFSPQNIIACFLKKRLTKGGGVTGTPGPPSLRPCVMMSFLNSLKTRFALTFLTPSKSFVLGPQT